MSLTAVLDYICKSNIFLNIHKTQSLLLGANTSRCTLCVAMILKSCRYILKYGLRCFSGKCWQLWQVKNY